MDIAIVTGASSSLGLAISKRLIQLGFRVYGLGGDYSDCPLNNVNFKPMGCDLADPEAVEEACRSIVEREKGVYVLVNNAKYFGRALFPEMDNAEMERILRINLLCPLVLSRTLAEPLMTLQGYIINLGTPYAETSRGGPVGAAASGGLKWMGEVLFHDLRHHGVRVCHISPEPNRGRDPRGIVRPGARAEAVIDPDAVAQAIEQILQSPFGNTVTEMIMRPLRVKEVDHDPVVRLPYPEPKPVPYTVPREMIEAEEKLEVEQDEKELEREKRQRRRGRQGGRKEREEDKPQAASGKQDEKPQAKAERKALTEKGRGKRPSPPADSKPEKEPGPAHAKPETEKPSAPQPHPEQQAKPAPDDRPSRHRRRRKPRPPKIEVGFHLPPRDEPPLEKAPEEKAKEPVDPEKEVTPVKKTTRKVAKKAAKKATKKAARKATRKAAKKATKKAARKAVKAESESSGKDAPKKQAAKAAKKATTSKKKTARKQAVPTEKVENKDKSG